MISKEKYIKYCNSRNGCDNKCMFCVDCDTIREIWKKQGDSYATFYSTDTRYEALTKLWRKQKLEKLLSHP